MRPAHPLLAATAARLATRSERRALHLDLARATEDEQQRVLHLALAAERPDAELSSRLARAASRAAGRGAAGEAVELAGHALRLTAQDARDRPARLLALGERLEAVGMDRSVERVAAVRLAWRGETAAARAALSDLQDTAEERGEDYSYLLARLHTCELELRVGDWTQASQSLEELAESADLEQLRGLVHERCRTLLAAGRGNPAAAERSARRAIAAANANGVVWQLLETLRARGLARLLAHDPRAAAADLGRVWEVSEREGIDDPGTFPVAPDLVEALLENADRDRARAVTARLQELSVAQQHSWGLVSARRCTALLDDEEETAEEIAAA